MQDLGGMGANESVPVVFLVKWTPPVWESVPLLLLAGVLWIERHRRRGNVWILLALVAGCTAQWGLLHASTFLPESFKDILEAVFRSLIFGNALMWLTSARLANPRRGATFLGMLAMTIVASGAMLCASIDIYDDSVALPASFLLLIFSAVTLATYEMALRACQNRPGMSRFILFMAINCLLMLTGMLLTINGLQGNTIGWITSLAIGGGVTAGIFFGLIPIIVVLFLHPDQRSRLHDLLHLSVGVCQVFDKGVGKAQS